MILVRISERVLKTALNYLISVNFTTVVETHKYFYGKPLSMYCNFNYKLLTVKNK